MLELQSKDYRDILRTVYDANSCDNILDFIKIVLPRVADMLHSECVTFQRVDTLQGHVRVVESKSFKAVRQNLIEDAYFPDVYKDSYYQHSPLLRAALNTPGNVFKIGGVISFTEWEKSIMYNNFILPQHLYREMLMAMRGRGCLYIITLWRDKHERDFAETDMEIANIIVPHLAVAIHNTHLISMIKSGGDGNFPGEGALGDGILLLDSKLKPCYFNLKAADICKQLISPHAKNDFAQSIFEIPSYILRDCMMIISMLKANGEPVVKPRERIIFAENGLRFRIECSMIWKADESNSVRPYFIVTFSELVRNDILTGRLNLSEREQDVLYCLISGLSYNEIADKLFISKLTVHTHVKNIYRKLGIRNKIELIKRVQSSAFLI